MIHVTKDVILPDGTVKVSLCMTEIKDMDYAELELRVLAQRPRKVTMWSTPTVDGLPLLGYLEAIDLTKDTWQRRAFCVQASISKAL